MLINERRGHCCSVIISKLYPLSTILASTIILVRTGSAVFSGQSVMRNRLFCNAFVTAVQVLPSLSKKASSETSSDMSLPTIKNEDECEANSLGKYSDIRRHKHDQSLWMYHVESTSSTMDEAKLLVETKFGSTEQNIIAGCNSGAAMSKGDSPESFCISATSQSNGRGTSQRKWDSSQTGNALFTIGIQQSAWKSELKRRNANMMVPLTLLPLKVGSVVAAQVKKFLREFTNDNVPRVAVKWPNDVLVYNSETFSYEKVAGILIESSQDWFLIGIGINMGYAPQIPSEGVNYGRKATALSQHCSSDIVSDELNWVEMSKELAMNVTYDLHSWLHHTDSSTSSSGIGDKILNDWKSYLDWNMELVLRDTLNKEQVTLNGVLSDGRVEVREVETGKTRILVSDYFL